MIKSRTVTISEMVLLKPRRQHEWRETLKDLRDLAQGLPWAARNFGAVKSIRSYCGFLGTGRSGHSLVGAFINAHPNAVISHELHALRYLRRPISRRLLFGMIVRRDRWFIDKGQRWWGYDYDVREQWQGRWEDLQVIGDKKGGKTTELLADHPELVDRLRKTVRVPLRFIYVLRNPYDNIATKYTRDEPRSLTEWCNRYFESVETVESLITQRFSSEEVLHLRWEDFIAEPATHLKRIAAFLDVDAREDWVTACASRVVSQPSRTRHKVDWPPALLQRVQDEIDSHPHLTGYTF